MSDELSDELAEYLKKLHDYTDYNVQDVKETESLVRSGRGPSGKLRNFGAMAYPKLQTVYEQVSEENNDTEALVALMEEMAARA